MDPREYLPDPPDAPAATGMGLLVQDGRFAFALLTANVSNLGEVKSTAEAGIVAFLPVGPGSEDISRAADSLLAIAYNLYEAADTEPKTRVDRITAIANGIRQMRALDKANNARPTPPPPLQEN